MNPRPIFLSRPTVIEAKYEVAHKAFETFLKDHSITPRRVGGSDYSMEVPLNAVLKVYKECEGAIILGYPQFCMQASWAPATTMAYSFKQPTPWNHIEAAIAYTKKLPVIAIADAGITGGIFDPKVVGKFVYSADLSNKKWFKEKAFTGFFNDWISKL